MRSCSCSCSCSCSFALLAEVARQAVRAGRPRCAGRCAAALRCSRHRLRRRTRCVHFVLCAQTAATSQMLKRAARAADGAARLGGAQGIARPAPPAGLEVAQSLRSPERDHNDRVHVGGWYVFGRLLRLRRAPQRQADQGRACLSEASLRGPRLTRGAAAKPEGPETSAAQRHTARRRPQRRQLTPRESKARRRPCAQESTHSAPAADAWRS
jgi:hypothetical protein